MKHLSLPLLLRGRLDIIAQLIIFFPFRIPRIERGKPFIFRVQSTSHYRKSFPLKLTTSYRNGNGLTKLIPYGALPVVDYSMDPEIGNGAKKCPRQTILYSFSLVPQSHMPLLYFFHVHSSNESLSVLPSLQWVEKGRDTKRKSSLVCLLVFPPVPKDAHSMKKWEKNRPIRKGNSSRRDMRTQKKN